MKIVDLNPQFLRTGGPGVTRDGQPVPLRTGVGLGFDCPCGCDDRAFVYFENPIDGSERMPGTTWKRTGETFDTLTLKPSIQRVGGCAWHGWITDGEAHK